MQQTSNLATQTKKKKKLVCKDLGGMGWREGLAQAGSTFNVWPQLCHSLVYCFYVAALQPPTFHSVQTH